MNYIRVSFHINPYEEYIVDVLNAELGEIGFESFVCEQELLMAYVTENDFDSSKLDALLKNFSFAKSIDYTTEQLVSKNWNEEWEKNFFQPILIGNECVIHSSFHKDVPQAKYDIVIDPKMSFGTGHHETTSLMIQEILKMDFSGKKLLDMGCGTSVLGILAAKCGAEDITAIDIDTWCIENSTENIALNNVKNINLLLGDAELLKGLNFDIIIANINRNILLNDMRKYAACLPVGGSLYMSGFYEADIPKIKEEGEKNQLAMEYFKEKNNWVVVKMLKK